VRIIRTGAGFAASLDANELKRTDLMTLRFSLAMVLAAGLALLFGVSGCNTDETNNVTTDGPPSVDITGSWTGTFTTADAAGDFNFSMAMDADGEGEGMNTRLGRFTGAVTGRSMTGTFTDSTSGDVATVEATKD
jgi:hypothetical protein